MGSRPVDDDRNAALAREARALHALVFGAAPTERLISRYVDVHAQRLDAAPSSLPVDVAALLDRDVDLEAVELALRLRDPGNTLSRKLRALCYLAEAEAPGYAQLVSHRDAPVAGFFGLVRATLRSGLRWWSGERAIRRHHVV